jgi:hypothetical protein
MNNFPPLNEGVTFDNAEAASNFTNQLMPPPAAMTITQPPVDEAMQAGGGTGDIPPPPGGSIPPQVGGGAGVPGSGQGAPGGGTNSGLKAALAQLGHTMYDTEMIRAELGVQRGVNPGDAASRAAFRDSVVNVQHPCVYLAMLGGHAHVTMIHTPGVYYSISPSTSAYQGKVLAFIGDCQATKEPTPVCLPTTKSWEWHTGDAVTDFSKLAEYYERGKNKGTLWTPGATDGATVAIQVPNLLAIPNALVDLLQNQGAVITPYDVLATIDGYLQEGGTPAEQKWEHVRNWCLVASQAGANGKGKVFLETSPVTIDEEDFDKWVANPLDITLGPRPLMTNIGTPGTPVGTQQGMDYLALLRMLATTMGTTMMQFSNTIALQILAAVGTGIENALATGKGFDQDQIAKLKDVCSILNTQHIPLIWSVIQATTGKSVNSYRAHLAKFIKSWCHAHHIDRDKSLFLEAKFFEDLVALSFNPGGPVAQFHSVAWGMSMLVCRSLMAAEAEHCRKYEEAAASTTHTRSLDKLLKQNCGQTVALVANYMDLKLNIGTYCGLLWSLFGDHCNYYRELLKIYCILDQEECFTIRNAYTKVVCAHITWAIIDNGRSFFRRNPVTSDFAPGTFQFLTSHLESIMDSVQNAIPIQRAMFPWEWMTPPVGSAAPHGGLPQGKPPTHRTPPASAPMPMTPTKPPQQKEDIRHPKIKLLMDPYLKRYNNFVGLLSNILTAWGRRLTDLPTLPNYCHPTGQSFLCWNSVLGKCFQGLQCKYSKGHVKKEDITDAFAEAVSDCISKGVLHYTKLPEGESPPD